MSLIPLLLLLFLPIITLYLLRPTKRPRNLPPGPFAWPVIGTILSKMKKQPHAELARLARIHGPLMLLYHGLEPVIVASTATAASEVLKSQDRALSARFAPNSVRLPGYIEHSMVWADCTDYWKSVRKIWRVELFSNRMLDLQARVREAKAHELVRFLRAREGQEVTLADVVFGSILNVLGMIVFSKDVFDLEGKAVENDTGMKGMIRQLMVLAAIPNLADLYPFLGRLDMQGLRRASGECVKRMNGSWAAIVKERRASGGGRDENDFLKVLIDEGFSDPQIDAMLLEIFGPGSDTSTSTIEWAVAELLRNPQKLAKVREELDSVIGRSGTPIKESDLPNLPYLHACVKETLRLHPPVTFLLPHRASEPCEVMGYTIPKDCQLMVNTYAIGRDPATWTEPEKFEPERFVGSEVDYQGNDFQYIPFGAGRRICPGMSLASRVVRLFLASLVHGFDLGLPNGMKAEEMDMTDRFGLALLKDVPLVVVPKVRA
ncbi:putative (S)-N-methylcoclaurine 3'-hydroxylase isozyme 2 [Acorus calamus]|uniref:(S)-N-methylcoclaurine 3'-hydroxylase isozyme 2 n=1 Tax=Acorus calamus TaxID=4465 RepID=A0AAV9EPC0_ACOCL|nr:putative (S)-N-methylcoclaurine 3'-hydroxylase isozyme 2 [Acorus calamus]KAK1315470.1 putative (S)-N-methylcoclaurine 3'-hydroxylase isozyme 2 [Acorus calamus]